MLASVHEAALGPAEADVMPKRTMCAFDELCLTPVEEMTPEDFRALRLREYASLAVFESTREERRRTSGGCGFHRWKSCLPNMPAVCNESALPVGEDLMVVQEGRRWPKGMVHSAFWFVAVAFWDVVHVGLPASASTVRWRKCFS